MAHVMRYTLRLFGPRKGETISINGHQFVDGYCEIVQKPEAVSYALKVLAMYGAYAKGTPEYDKAEAEELPDILVEATEELAKEITNGLSDQVDTSIESGQAAEVHGSSGETGESPAEEAGSEREGHVGADEGDSGVHANRDGHEGAGIIKFEDAENRVQPEEPKVEVDEYVKAAVEKLDPSNDEHWTGTGLPRLSAVEDALGRAGVTRSAVEAAMPGYTREAALL